MLYYTSFSTRQTNVQRASERLPQEQTKPANHLVIQTTVGNVHSHLSKKGHLILQFKATYVFYTKTGIDILNFLRGKNIWGRMPNLVMRI